MKKLLPALTMLIVTIALLGTSTFAWFSMTTDTPVDGMEFNVKTYSNLLIAPNTNNVNFNEDYEFVNSLTQVIGTNTNPVYLEPISSVNGLDFFYNDKNNARANGQTINALDYAEYSEATAADFFPVASKTRGPNATYYAKTAYDTAFNNNYLYSHTGESSNNYAYGYIDYNFQLKAQNAQTSGNLDLMLTELTLTYQGTNPELTAFVSAIRAYRVAIFMEEKDSSYNGSANTFTGNTAASAANLKAIYTPENATNFNDATGIVYTLVKDEAGTNAAAYAYKVGDETIYAAKASAGADENAWYSDPDKGTAIAANKYIVGAAYNNTKGDLYKVKEGVDGTEVTAGVYSYEVGGEPIYGDTDTATALTKWYTDEDMTIAIAADDISVDAEYTTTKETDVYKINVDAAGTLMYSYDVEDTIYSNAATAGAATEWYSDEGGAKLETVAIGAKTEKHTTPIDGNRAVGSETALGITQYNQVQSGDYFYQIAPQTTKYYQVTVRLWLEGEDTTCFNEAFLKLNQDWKFNLQFSLGTGTNVDYLTIEQAS